jgi:hypothetical protein
MQNQRNEKSYDNFIFKQWCNIVQILGREVFTRRVLNFTFFTHNEMQIIPQLIIKYL